MKNKEAHNAGWNAYFADTPVKNPYSLHSQQGKQWAAGFEAAERFHNSGKKNATN